MSLLLQCMLQRVPKQCVALLTVFLLLFVSHVKISVSPFIDNPGANTKLRVVRNDSSGSGSGSRSNGGAESPNLHGIVQEFSRSDADDVVIPPSSSSSSSSSSPSAARRGKRSWCANRTQYAVPMSDAMRTDPEANALRPWKWTKTKRSERGEATTENRDDDRDDDDDDDAVEIPGLDSDLIADAFRGRRTVLVGDSTTRNLSKLLRALVGFADRELLDGMRNQSLTDAMRTARLTLKKRAFAGGKFNVPTFDDHVGGGTHVEFIPLMGGCIEHDEWRSRIKQARPDVLVANRGLHLLHLFDAGRDVSSCVVEWWVSYEKRLDDIIDAAENSGVKVLIFKTTNFVCDEKFWGEWLEASRLYSEGGTEIMSRCIDGVKKLGPDVGSSDIERYCRYGVFNDVGARYLNDRLIRHLERRKGQVNLKLEVFNDHDVLSCAYTRDGRHYPTLVMLRLRLLGNLIRCLIEE